MRPLFANAVSALTMLAGCARREAPVPIRAEPSMDSAMVDVAVDTRPTGGMLKIAFMSNAVEKILGYPQDSVDFTMSSTSPGTLLLEMRDREAVVYATREPIDSAARTVSVWFHLYPMDSFIDPPGSTGVLWMGKQRRHFVGFIVKDGGAPDPDPLLARTPTFHKDPQSCPRDHWCELATWVFHKKGAPPDAGATNPIWTLRAKLE